jgi:hypothetical protein
LGRLDETNKRRIQLGHGESLDFAFNEMLVPQRPHAGTLSLLRARSAPHPWHFTNCMQAPWSGVCVCRFGNDDYRFAGGPAPVDDERAALVALRLGPGISAAAGVEEFGSASTESRFAETFFMAP